MPDTVQSTVTLTYFFSLPSGHTLGVTSGRTLLVTLGPVILGPEVHCQSGEAVCTAARIPGSSAAGVGPLVA